MMLDELNHYFQLFSEFTKSSPVVAGLVSLWGLGVLTFLLRNVPQKVYNFIKKQCTTSLLINNSNIGSNRHVFLNFTFWLNNSKWSRFSRSMAVDAVGLSWDSINELVPKTIIGIGEGTHFFIYNRRLFWASRSKLPAQSSSEIHYEINICMLGRNRQKLFELYDSFNPPIKDDRIGVYVHDSANGWSRLTTSDRRPLNTVIMPGQLKEELLQKVQWFLDNRTWYAERGLAYKMTIVLHGPSGTGKTSIIKAIAGHLNLNLALLNLNELSPKSLRHAFSRVPKNSIVLIEDFDSCRSLTRRRTVKETENNYRQKPTSKEPAGQNTLGEAGQNLSDVLKDWNALELSDFLNIFDGAVSLDGVITFLTTNVLNEIDPAFIRPRRVDRIYEVGYLDHDDVCRYVNMIYKGQSWKRSERFAPIAGCVLEEVYFDHAHDVQEFVDAIPKEASSSEASTKFLERPAFNVVK